MKPPKDWLRGDVISADRLTTHSKGIRELQNISGEPPIKVSKTAGGIQIALDPTQKDWFIGRIHEASSDFTDCRYWVERQESNQYHGVDVYSDVVTTEIADSDTKQLEYGDTALLTVTATNLAEYHTVSASDTHRLKVGQKVFVKKELDASGWNRYVFYAGKEEFCRALIGSDVYSPLENPPAGSDITGSMANPAHSYITGYMYSDVDGKLNPWFCMEDDQVGASDELVKVSANDDSAGYLNGKLVGDAGDATHYAVTLEELNDGAVESLKVRVTKATDNDKLVKVSANDTTPGYLNGKLIVDAGDATHYATTFVEGNDGGDETLKIRVTKESGDLPNGDTEGEVIHWSGSAWIVSNFVAAPTSANMLYWDSSGKYLPTSAPTIIGQVPQYVGGGAIDFSIALPTSGTTNDILVYNSAAAGGATYENLAKGTSPQVLQVDAAGDVSWGLWRFS